MNAESHPGIPVAAAKQIAETFGKTHVVIIGYDRREEMTYTATYGVEALDKVQAARLGDILTAATGASLKDSTMYEDFRTDFDAALLREAVELIRRAVKAHDHDLIRALDDMESFLTRNEARLKK